MTQEEIVAQRTELRVQQSIGSLTVQRDMLLAQGEFQREQIVNLQGEIAALREENAGLRERLDIGDEGEPG